jgi:hypothetical protein
MPLLTSQVRSPVFWASTKLDRGFTRILTMCAAKKKLWVDVDVGVDDAQVGPPSAADVLARRHLSHA